MSTRHTVPAVLTAARFLTGALSAWRAGASSRQQRSALLMKGEL